MAAYLRAHCEMGCEGIVAMPNTVPPVSRVTGEGTGEYWTIQGYLEALKANGGDAFETLIVPLYLTRHTTAEMIEQGAASGLLQACKYYPPHGTTNAGEAVPLDRLLGGDVLAQLEETGTILCVHGEAHGLASEKYFDAAENAESLFYREWMPRLLERHPRLRIVCEHVSTAEAVALVREAGDRVGATVTPQHLLFTVGHLLRGFRPPLYCLPVVKYRADREALRDAVTALGQRRFFAGTDSAPHAAKATECGCAAGCYTGGCAPQLYAMAFERSGVDLDTEPGRERFERFLCRNGPDFYGLEPGGRTFRLERGVEKLEPTETLDGPVLPLPLGLELEVNWRLIRSDRNESERPRKSE